MPNKICMNILTALDKVSLSNANVYKIILIAQKLNLSLKDSDDLVRTLRCWSYGVFKNSSIQTTAHIPSTR